MRLKRMFNKINRRKLVLTSILILAALWALRFDYTYSMLPYRVQQHDTLEQVLHNRLFHDEVIANASIDYIRMFNSNFDADQVMKNVEGQGGYRVEVWFNKLTIYGPNNAVVMESNVLPSSALLAHLLQVAVHNLIVLAFSFWAWVVLGEYQFGLSSEWQLEIAKPVGLWFVASPFIVGGLLMGLLLLLGTIGGLLS